MVAPGCAGNSRRASGCRTSMSTCTSASGGSARRSMQMAGSADSSPASRNERTAGSISYPRPVPETATRSPALAVSAHAERIPFPCRTTSTSSSSGPGLNQSGVSVRMVGRLPSANRNSFPAHVGRTTSAGSPGSRTRTLAAGSPGSSPWSIGPARVIRTIWGLRGSIRATSTMRNGGGSLRARIALTATQRCRTLCRTLPDQPCTESFTQTRIVYDEGGPGRSEHAVHHFHGLILDAYAHAGRRPARSLPVPDHAGHRIRR